MVASSSGSAEMLHLEKDVGMVEVGKAADLVVLDADPLGDIANVRSIRAVVRDGRLFDRATLDELLNQAAARLGSPPSSPSR
jgi:imidazolonepropionase-like amidohydrolase